MKTSSKLALLSSLLSATAYAAPTGRIVAETPNKIGILRAATGKRLTTVTKYQPAKQRDSLVAITTETEVQVRNTKTGTTRTLFSIKRPQTMFDALKRAKYPSRVKDFRDSIDEELWKDQIHWQSSDAVLAPDHSRIYFGSNAGTGMGAAGNATWALFAYDLKRNRLDVLSKVGQQFGRQPMPLLLSRDGKKMLAVVSVHDSAMDNTCYALLIDLLTQNSRELLLSLPTAKGKANLVSGAAFSPDSRYVALSAYFYSVEALLKQENFDQFEPKDSQFTTYIFDVNSGKVARRLANTTILDWVK